MYILCMVGSGNGASNWAEMLIGHVWGGPVVGTTYLFIIKHQFVDFLRPPKMGPAMHLF